MFVKSFLLYAIDTIKKIIKKPILNPPESEEKYNPTNKINPNINCVVFRIKYLFINTLIFKL